MKVKYDREVDVLRIILAKGSIAESDEKAPGLILDYDKKGKLVGIEVLGVSKRLTRNRTDRKKAS